MDSGVTATVTTLGRGPLSPMVDDAGPSVAVWESAAGRVADYLRAMGIADPLHIDRLSTRVRSRWEARASAVPLEDPVEAGIEETHALLDDWLCVELGIAGDRDALFTARAAVLSGAVANWPARFAGVSGESLAPQIRAASVQAMPEPAPLTMEPSTIDLFGHRLARRIAAAFRVLIGNEPVGESVVRPAADPTAAPISDRGHLGQPR